MRYTLQDYSDVLFTGYIYELPENTQNIIKNLTKELGVVIAAAMAASTISQKPDDFFKHSNLHYNKRVKSDYKNKQRTDDSWKGTIAFKATKIEKKEGAEKLMNEIRVCLNKISNKNFEQQRDAIFNWIQEVLEEQDKDIQTLPDEKPPSELSLHNVGVLPPPDQTKNVKIIAQSIFDIASSNKFYSEIYAILYRELIEKYSFFSDYISNVITEYYDGIDKIEFVDSNNNYDKYCENNKLNDKRKAMSTFIVNLMKQQLLPKNEVLELIISIQNKIFENIDIDGKTNWIDEVTENLYILISLVAQDQDTDGGSIEEQVGKIRNNIEICSKYKVKEYKSISSRAIFKYMDILEILK